MPASNPGAARRFLDDKVAQSLPFQYKLATAPKWIVKVRNYVVGIYPEMLNMLKWAENQQHRVIASTEVPALRGIYMMDQDPVLLTSAFGRGSSCASPTTTRRRSLSTMAKP